MRQSVEFVDSLPMTAVGKVDRRFCGESWRGRDRQVG